MKKTLDAICQAVFWLWNLTFLTTIYLGILPTVGLPLLQAAIAGVVPADFLFSLFLLVAIPTACAFLGTRFAKQPRQLMRLFYGVEAPLFLLCLLRLFLMRELTGASMQMLGTVVVCVLAFLAELIYGYAGDRADLSPKASQAIATVQLICHSFMLLTGLWVGSILLFYTVPLAPAIVWEVLKFQWVGWIFDMIKYGYWEAIWWLPISLGLFVFSASLFLVMPYALTKIYLQAYSRIIVLFARQYSTQRTWFISVAAVTAWAVVFVSLQQQPQAGILAMLQNPPANDSAKQTLLAKSEPIRQGLVNAYLHPYRYLSTRKESNGISHIYESTFQLPKPAAEGLQNIFNYLMSPFLYNGNFDDDEKAAQLYAQFFDAPIQRVERDAIEHALQSTYNQDEAKAGLLNINQQKVWLAQQQVTVKPQGDFAQVELYEVYENQTRDQQEVFYYFSLPESAAITGLWLGDTGDRSTAFAYVVSPRGAAQKVYNAEVQRRVDPALLEQVGPRNYRLRAFPVPVKPWPAAANETRPAKLHLWLTYQVLQQDGVWPLPQLAEKRNVFWTSSSQRQINGQAMKTNDWLPASMPADKAAPEARTVGFPEGYSIAAKPLASSDRALPQGKKFALVLDTSRSMGERAKDVKDTFAWLQANGYSDGDLANSDADLYLGAIAGNEPQRLDDLSQFDPAKLVFYGSLQYSNLLQQFAKLRGNTAYDAILLVTDQGSYELTKDPKTPATPQPQDKTAPGVSSNIPPLNSPLWMVHLGGQFPPAYDDATLKAIQDSGGGIAAQLPDVMQRLATRTALGKDAIAVADGYAWLMQKLPANAPINDKLEGFNPIAAKFLVQGLSKDKNQLGQLDAIHAIAKRASIVTPYSSMIVLVNEEQRKALKKAEQESDRFERKVETGNETLSKPMNPMVSAVPEPGEWLLLGLATIGLILAVRHQRRASKA